MGISLWGVRQSICIDLPLQFPVWYDKGNWLYPASIPHRPLRFFFLNILIFFTICFCSDLSHWLSLFINLPCSGLYTSSTLLWFVISIKMTVEYYWLKAMYPNCFGHWLAVRRYACQFSCPAFVYQENICFFNCKVSLKDCGICRKGFTHFAFLTYLARMAQTMYQNILYGSISIFIIEYLPWKPRWRRVRGFSRKHSVVVRWCQSLTIAKRHLRAFLMSATRRPVTGHGGLQLRNGELRLV